MDGFYKINIEGREEELPIITLPSGIKIAFLNLHGNVELTEFCGKKLAETIRGLNIEVLLTAESKGLQLTHVVARELGHSNYVAARKGRKIYMDEFLTAPVKAITGENSHELYISKADGERLEGKRVAIIDDVISSGGSLKGLISLVKQAGGMHITSACVLAEGDSIPNPSIMRLANLPLL